MVRVSVAVPLKSASGVYDINSGFEVWLVELKIPPPVDMVHAPDEAPPPIVAPVRLIADGLED